MKLFAVAAKSLCYRLCLLKDWWLLKTYLVKKVSGKIQETLKTITGLSNNLLKFSSDSIAVAKEFIAADIKSGQSKLANDSVTLAEFKKLAAIIAVMLRCSNC